MVEKVNILVILAHPDEGSFNHAIASSAVSRIERNGHRAIFHDLYREGFDPLLWSGEMPKDAELPAGITEHCNELASADGIMVVHPNWWGQPPAILKGWVDRVVRPGVAYKFLEGDGGEGVPTGLLKAKTVLVFNTSNTPSEREEKEFGDPLEALWKNCVFGLCGVSTFRRRMFNVVVTSTAERRAGWLKEVDEIVDRHFPAAPSPGPSPVGVNTQRQARPGDCPSPPT